MLQYVSFGNLTSSAQVKLLRAVSELSLNDLVIGQFTPSADGSKPGYLVLLHPLSAVILSYLHFQDDPGVPKDSVTPTFAAAVLRINNSRWSGTPFILKCGKGK